MITGITMTPTRQLTGTLGFPVGSVTENIRITEDDFIRTADGLTRMAKSYKRGDRSLSATLSIVREG